MKRLPVTRLAALLLPVILLAAAAFAEPMTYSGNFDIGAWKAEAQKAFNFANEDAVILLEGHKQTLLPDGRTRSTVHRVVWISTEHAIETYADLRIPWDSARQTFEVKALRVWRDNRWIEHRPTAIVPTTPFEVGDAPEYTWLRETMLLHDGIELPCILEACYVIEDKAPVLGGYEGVYEFQREDPVLNSWLILETPHNRPLKLALSDGLGEATVTRTDSVDTWTLQRGPFVAAPTPETVDPASYLPSATYSTWRSWQGYGKMLRTGFDGAQVLNVALKDSVAALLKGAMSSTEKATRIAAFVKRNTRYIDYPEDFFWAAPREAFKTFNSAYASGVDRAILFAALAKEGGLQVWPYYHGLGYGPVNADVASNDRLDGIGVWTNDDDVNAGYDPKSGELFNGFRPIFGRTMWLPGSGDAPKVNWTGTSEAVATLNVHLDADAHAWVGDGYYSSTGGICPFDKMAGTGDEALDVLGDVASGLLPDCEVSAYNPVTFDRFNVAAGFKVKAAAADRDDMGRLPVVVDEPGYGLFAILPEDVHLYESSRGTPVHLAGALAQTASVGFDLGGLEPVYLPESTVLENSAGRFELKVERSGDRVTLTRILQLNEARFDAAQWPDLRALLLAEKAERNRTLLLK